MIKFETNQRRVSLLKKNIEIQIQMFLENAESRSRSALIEVRIRDPG